MKREPRGERRFARLRCAAAAPRRSRLNQHCASLAGIKVQFALTLRVDTTYKADYRWLESRSVPSPLTVDLTSAMSSFMTLLLPGHFPLWRPRPSPLLLSGPRYNEN